MGGAHFIPTKHFSEKVVFSIQICYHYPSAAKNSSFACHQKKVLALVLAFACAFTMFAGAAFTDSADIKTGEAVDMLVALGVIDGYADGSFKPEGTVTRAEMAKMIYVIRTGRSDASAYNDDKTTFTDIGDHWARGYIKYCQSLGIIAGKSTTKFDPNGKVTTAEAAKMLLVTLGYNAQKAGLEGTTWSQKTVALADENGLLKDVVCGTSAAAPRQYAAQLMYNAIFANTVTLRDGEYTKYGYDNSLNPTIGEKYMDLYKTEAGVLHKCDLVDGKDYYTITTSGYTDAKGNRITTFNKVPTDVSSMIGQEIVVLRKVNASDVTVYGVYTDDDSKVVATGYVGQLETVSSGDKIKLAGTEYKLAGNDTNDIVYRLNQDTTAQVSVSLNSLATSVTGSPAVNVAAQPIKLIDNDGNGKVDLAVVTPVQVGKVTSVSKTSVAIDSGVGTKKFDDFNVYDGVAKNDYVMVIADTNTSDGKGAISKLDVISGKITGLRTDEVQVDGTWYTTGAGVPTMNVGDSYDIVAVGGVVLFAEMTAASDRDILTLSAVEGGTDTTNFNTPSSDLDNDLGSTDKYLKAKAYFMDGTSAEIKITKIDGTKIGSVASVDSDITPATLYTYSKLSDGTYDVTPLDNTTNKAGYDLINTGAYNKQKIDGKTLNDDAVVFVMGTTEVKVLTGAQIKDWGDAAAFNGMYAATESNGINYIQVAAIAGAGNVPNADGDYKFAYMLSNSYSTSMEGEDGTKYAYDVWTGSKSVTLYAESNTSVASGSILAYKEDGKFITVAGSYKPSATGANGSASELNFYTVAVTGFDNKVEGNLVASTLTGAGNEYTLHEDCVFIAVDSKNEASAEGDINSVTFANPNSTNTKYVPNAVIVTLNKPRDSNDGKVLAIIYDAVDIDWNGVTATFDK